MGKIYAIVKGSREKIGRIVEVDNTLKAFQKIVGGYIQAVPVSDDLTVICDEEGLIKGYPLNCWVGSIGFHGTIAVVGTKGEEFADVPISLDEWERIIYG